MSLNKIEIKKYNPLWKKYFKTEAEKIHKKLEKDIAEIHHIGSTAILDMPAKPIIDILLEVNDIENIANIEEGLVSIGYQKLNRNVIPLRSYFTQKHTPLVSYNCHIYEVGDPQVSRHVFFRDYMKSHKDDACAYSNLKSELARSFSKDILQYVTRKEKFVQMIDAKAKRWGLNNDQDSKFLKSRTKKNTKIWSNKALVSAAEVNLYTYLTHYFQYLPNFRLIRKPGYALVDSGCNEGLNNYIIDTHFSLQEVEEKIIEVTNYFNQKNLSFSWWICPDDKPSNLDVYLKKIGFHLAEIRKIMYLDLIKQEFHDVSNECEIRKCTSKESFNDIVFEKNNKYIKDYINGIAQICSPTDPVQFYVAYFNNKPVASTALVVYAQIAGIYSVCSIDDKYKTYLENFLLQQAKMENYAIAMIYAFDKESRHYITKGFKNCCNFIRWEHQI